MFSLGLEDDLDAASNAIAYPCPDRLFSLLLVITSTKAASNESFVLWG